MNQEQKVRRLRLLQDVRDLLESSRAGGDGEISVRLIQERKKAPRVEVFTQSLAKNPDATPEFAILIMPQLGISPDEDWSFNEAMAWEQGLYAARERPHEVLFDLDGGEKFCRIEWAEDSGDPSVGIQGCCGWVLSQDQQGMTAADYIDTIRKGLEAG